MRLVNQGVAALLGIGMASIGSNAIAQDQNFSQVEIETIPVDVKLRTEKAIAEGTSLEDFIASKPTADYDEAWGGGFLKPEDFLTIVYKSLAE